MTNISDYYSPGKATALTIKKTRTFALGVTFAPDLGNFLSDAVLHRLEVLETRLVSLYAEAQLHDVVPNNTAKTFGLVRNGIPIKGETDVDYDLTEALEAVYLIAENISGNLEASDAGVTVKSTVCDDFVVSSDALVQSLININELAEDLLNSELCRLTDNTGQAILHYHYLRLCARYVGKVHWFAKALKAQAKSGPKPCHTWE